MSIVALFGSSYIARLGRFCNDDFQLSNDATCRIFAEGGMRADKISTVPRFRKCLQELLSFKADVVYVCLGGNDITVESTPAEIFRSLVSVIDAIKASGVKTVLVQEIVIRGRFRGGLRQEHFLRQQRAVNKKLHQAFKDNYVKMNISFPSGYDEDLVHFSEKGMKKYFHNIR